MTDKSMLLVTVAGLPDGDPRLPRLAAILAGRSEPDERPNMRLMRMGQAARETGLSRVTLWRAIREGRLRSVEVRAGSRRVPEAELRRFVEGR